MDAAARYAGARCVASCARERMPSTMHIGGVELHAGRLARTFSVIRYDRRGHSRSQYAGPAPRRRDEDDLAEALGLGPAHLVGTSYGASISLALAVRRPHGPQPARLGRRRRHGDARLARRHGEPAGDGRREHREAEQDGTHSTSTGSRPIRPVRDQILGRLGSMAYLGKNLPLQG